MEKAATINFLEYGKIDSKGKFFENDFWHGPVFIQQFDTIYVNPPTPTKNQVDLWAIKLVVNTLIQVKQQGTILIFIAHTYSKIVTDLYKNFGWTATLVH